MFPHKLDGVLNLYMKYSKLNAIETKNRYDLILIDKIFDSLIDAPVFTKINMKNTYYCL